MNLQRSATIDDNKIRSKALDLNKKRRSGHKSNAEKVAFLFFFVVI